MKQECEMSDTELLPCPFCGAEAKKMLHNEDMWKFLHSETCYFHKTDHFHRPHIVDLETVDTWNARVSPELPELNCDRCQIRQDAKQASEVSF